MMPGDPYMHSPRGGPKSLLQHQAENFKHKAEAWSSGYLFLPSLSTGAFRLKNRLMPHAQRAGRGMYIMYDDNNQENLSSLNEKKSGST